MYTSLVQKIYPITYGIECISDWNYNGYDIEKRYTISKNQIDTLISIPRNHLYYDFLDKLYEQRFNPDSQVFIRCQNTIRFHKKNKYGTVFGWSDIDDDIVIYICDQLSKYKIYNHHDSFSLIELYSQHYLRNNEIPRYTD